VQFGGTSEPGMQEIWLSTTFKPIFEPETEGLVSH
jgi:hypothetical protein